MGGPSGIFFFYSRYHSSNHIGIGTVLCDGGGRHHRRGGRTLSNYGNSQNIETGYSSPNDGGIYSSGFHTNDADFGNQYSAQNVQPSYGQQPQYGASGGGGGGGQAQYGAQADDNIAMLEKAVPGVPGQDYPIYAEVRQYFPRYFYDVLFTI